MKAANCDPFWLPRWILSLRSSHTFPLRPNMVWLMRCKWGIWNTLAIHLYLVLSHFQIFCRTFNTSLLDEANAFFLLWHFKVRDVKEATVSNYVQLILDSQNHQHASIRHFSIWGAALPPCGQLVYGLFVMQTVSFTNPLLQEYYLHTKRQCCSSAMLFYFH